MVEIRVATIENLEDIISLNQQLFDYEFENFDDTLDCKWPSRNKDYYKGRIEGKDSLALVALDKGKIVGYLIGSLPKAEGFRKIERIAELDNMFVLPTHWRKGIGTALCKRFLSWAKEKGVKRVRVVASAQNKQAIAFYKKNRYSDYNIMLEADI